jgi:hypothetical protein
LEGFLRGREKWRFGEETEAKRVTESDQTLASGALAHSVSSGRGTCEGVERADAGQGAPVRTGLWTNTVHHLVMLMWQCAVR